MFCRIRSHETQDTRKGAQFAGKGCGGGIGSNGGVFGYWHAQLKAGSTEICPSCPWLCFLHYTINLLTPPSGQRSDSSAIQIFVANTFWKIIDMKPQVLTLACYCWPTSRTPPTESPFRPLITGCFVETCSACVFIVSSRWVLPEAVSHCSLPILPSNGRVVIPNFSTVLMDWNLKVV